MNQICLDNYVRILLHKWIVYFKKLKTKLNNQFLYLLDSRLEELIYYDNNDNSIKHIILHDGLVFVTDINYDTIIDDNYYIFNSEDNAYNIINDKKSLNKTF